MKTLQSLEKIYRGTWKSAALFVGLCSIVLFANKTNFPLFPIFILCVFLAIAFLFSRFIGTLSLTLINKKYDTRKSVAILGMNNGGLKLGNYLNQQNSLNFVGFLDSNAPKYHSLGQKKLSAKDYLKAAAESGVEEVFVSVNTEQINDLSGLIEEGEKNCIRLKFVPDLSALNSNLKVDTMGSFTILSPGKDALEKVHNRFKKRLFDILFSSFVLIFIFSWLYPLLAIIIKLQSSGPVIFAQLRTGRNNKPFWCYKFRSMRVNSESDTRQAQKNDDRITPIGRFMRRTSLDEFPQFFNVLLGYMSVIGPRPHMLSHTDEYRYVIEKYMSRQFLKPGISGWAQVNGYRGETKENHLMQKRVQYDLWYKENWTAMLDVKITFLTVIGILKGDKNTF
jgi:Undecaprenyl-phosphate glucose phosphotransferase